jgi:hypothetical protein
VPGCTLYRVMPTVQQVGQYADIVFQRAGDPNVGVSPLTWMHPELQAELSRTLIGQAWNTPLFGQPYHLQVQVRRESV